MSESLGVNAHAMVGKKVSADVILRTTVVGTLEVDERGEFYIDTGMALGDLAGGGTEKRGPFRANSFASIEEIK